MTSIDDQKNLDERTNGLALEGPSARLTREFSLDDIPSLPADAVRDLEPPSKRPVPPPPPSSRRRPNIEGGAAAPAGGGGARQPLVTHPRPRAPVPAPMPRVIAPAAPTPQPAHYLGATLPDRQHREAFDAVEIEAPEGTIASQSPGLARLRASRPLAAVGAVTLAAVTFAIGVAIFRTSGGVADTAPAPLPTFLDLPSGVQPSPPALPDAPKAPLPQLGEAPLAAAPPAPLGETPAPPPPAASDPSAPTTEPPRALEAEPVVSVVSAPPERSAVLSAPAATHPSPPAPALDPVPAPPASASLPAAESRSTSLAAPPAAAPEAPQATATALTAAKDDVAAPSSDPARLKPAAVAPAPPATVGAPNSRPAPPSDAIVRRRTTYRYADSETFVVATAPKRVTDVILEAGEKIVARPTPGDAALWVVDVVDSVHLEEPQQHVYIRPLRAATSTNLNIATNRRNYHLELESSSPATYMAAVDWRYPASEADRRRRQNERESYEHRTTTRIDDVKAINFEYAVTVASGEPAWKPTMAFDDGVKTFIRFPQRVEPEHAPLLLVQRSGSARGAQYVNHRVTGDLYVIDRIIDAAELRLPKPDGDEVVRIIRSPK